ncbi:hypothetical protein OIU76_023045 [Salix suchowensis]|nr:hypothetical protein OIU76_023045 [Salix suchowensis]
METITLLLFLFLISLPHSKPDLSPRPFSPPQPPVCRAWPDTSLEQLTSEPLFMDWCPILKDLVRLNLAENNFTGEISPGFNNFTRLRTLYLEDNSLSGSLPDLKLQKLKQFNPLPDCKASRGAIVVPSTPNGGVEGKRKKLSGGAIAERRVVVSQDRLTLHRLNKRWRFMGDKPIVEAENGGGYGSGYSVAAAAAAAMVGSGKGGDLNSAGAKKRFLGKGTFGTAYKAVLEMGTVVAVKRLRDVTISEREFREKIETVGAMDHENLVPLRAYYYSRDEKLLVYDYMSMGSLSALLHGNKGAGRTPLDWKIRSGIALATARGIEYLHSQGPSVSHGNIKSSNILLTQSYDARVSDFGLAHLVGPTSTPNRVAGYRAPEVTDPRKVSQKADVYSFGVLLLELLTGKAPSHALLNEEGVDLPRWVQSIVREEWTSGVFDAELLRYQNVEEEMVQLLQLGVDCAAQYPDNRPSISGVTRRIEELCRIGLLEDHAPQPESSTDADDNSSR